MEIYNQSGKLKTESLLITRPIGALIVGMSQPFSALTNETITAHIERANGNNTEILPADFPLKSFLALSTMGNPAIYEENNVLSALAELCEEGSINLQETESIKIKLDGLKSTVTYSLHGLEYPTLGNSVSRFSRKNLLTEESQRRFDVADQEGMLIEGIDSIIEMNVAFTNGHVCKYVPEEIKAISRDVDAVKLISLAGASGAVNSTQFDLAGLVSFPLVDVVNVDVKKKTDNKVTFYLKNSIATY